MVALLCLVGLVGLVLVFWAASRYDTHRYRRRYQHDVTAMLEAQGQKPVPPRRPYDWERDAPSWSPE